MIAHTPGPFTFDVSLFEPNRYRVLYDNGRRWLMAVQHNGEQLPVEQEANMRLFCAATELLAALRMIETICLEDNSACRKRQGTRVGNALMTARDAIAKATGETR